MPNFGSIGEFNPNREDWENYTDRLDEFFVANKITDKAQKRAIFNSNVGPDTYKLLVNLLSPRKPKECEYDELVAVLKKHYKPVINSIMARNTFDSRVRQSGETVQNYLTGLRAIALDCKFGDNLEERLKDRFVTGLNDPRITKNLMVIPEDKLDLQKALDTALALELADKQSMELSQRAQQHGQQHGHVDSLQHPSNPHHLDTQQHVESLRPSNPRPRYPDSRPTGARPKTYAPYQQTMQPPRNTQRASANFQAYVVNCGNCGKQHVENRCPARGKPCYACGKSGHFSSMCRSSRRNTRPPNSAPNRNVYDLDLETQDYSHHGAAAPATTEMPGDPQYQYDQYLIEGLTSGNTKDEIFTSLDFNGMTVNVKLDTGAKCNVLPNSLVDKLSKHGDMVINTHKRANLIAFGGSQIITEGVVIVTVNDRELEFQVVNKPDVKPLLGLDACLQLGLITLSPEVFEINKKCTDVDAFTDYPEVFDDSLGQLPVTYTMTMDSTVTPVVRPPRRVPAAMQNKVKQELNRMVNIGVITPCNEPTDWVSSMSPTHKKRTDDIRICIDPRDLNKGLKRPHHPTRTVEQVAANMNGATIFSVLDAKSSFWQIPLDEKSSMLTCFSTSYGRYRFLRLPYGLCSSSDVFQHAIEHLFADVPCAIIVDDILVGGKDQEEHDHNLRLVLNRARQVNLKLNPTKCKFGVTNVNYVGHTFTSDGLKPDPEKVKAITDMPSPDSVQSLQRYLGMVNYLAKFIPNLSDVAAPLRELTHKNVSWCWYEKHQQAYDQVQNLVSRAPLLKYYDVTKPVTLTCDASKFGLGAACLQDGEPIAYASCTMKTYEQNYAQIEKELLAIVFACRKFYHYVYGKPVIVETDHKPLVTIINKPMHAIPARLQKMMLQLQKFDITLKYTKGADLFIADTLSRAPQPDHTSDLIEQYEVMSILPISSTRITELQRNTVTDDLLQCVSGYIKTGWPQRVSSVPQHARNFFLFRDELTISDNLVMKGLKVIVPKSLQATYAKLLHEGHLGCEATKRRARDIVFWTTMTQDIESHVSRCSVCNSTKAHQQKEPLMSYPTPTVPWETVGVDLFQWNGTHYVAIGDSYSTWFDFFPLPALSSYSVIQILKRQFSTHGIPQMLISDNGPQFSSHEFADFVKSYDFRHVTSSPQYPQSNGLAESAVKRSKQLLEKTEREQSDLYRNLLNVRNTPTTPSLGSPAQRLMSRRLRTTIPVSEQLLKPEVTTNVSENIQKRRQQSKLSYDKTAQPLKALLPGQPVRLQTTKGFDHLGTVVKSTSDPRSYIVNVHGTNYRRNRRHILPVNEQLPKQQSADSDILIPTTTQLPGHYPQQLPDVPPQAMQPPQVVVTRTGRISKPNSKYKDYTR